MKKFSKIVEKAVDLTSENKVHAFHVWWEKDSSINQKLMEKTFKSTRHKFKPDEVAYETSTKQMAILYYKKMWQPSRIEVRRFLKAWSKQIEKEVKMTDTTFPINIGKVVTFVDGKPLR
jgi:hypothetical protein